MKAILWKELRLNLPWSALAVVIGSAPMAAALGMARQFPDVPYDGGVSICSSQFLTTITFSSALWGIAVGLLLTVPDSQRDRRSFFLHRPASWSRLFLGKAAAALILTVVPLGIPFVLAAIWVATPGHFPAPFDWRMMTPGLVDLFGGFIFALAGMLAGLRPVRWYGSRGLGIAAAVMASLLIHSTESLITALLILLGSALVLGLASWGSFLTGGEYRPQPRTAKAALGLASLAGLGVVFSVLWMIVIIFQVVPSPQIDQYFIDKKERILVAHSTGGFSGSARVTDLSGQPVPEYSGVSAWMNGMLEAAPVVLYEGYPSRMSYRSSDRYFFGVHQTGDDRHLWYFARDLGLVLGYNMQTRRLEETVGPRGFAAPGQSNVSFEGGVLSSEFNTGLLLFPGDAYYPDFKIRTVRHLYHSPTPDVRGAGMAWGGPFAAVTLQDSPLAQEPPAWAAILAGSRFHLIRLDGTRIGEFNLTQDSMQYDQISISWNGTDGNPHVWYRPSFRLPMALRSTIPDIVEQYTPSGELVKTQTLPPLRSPDHPDYKVAALIPPAAVAMLKAFPRTFEDGPPGEFTRFLLVSLAVSMPFALICFWLSGRYGFRPGPRLWWTAFVIMAGPLGLLTYFALLDRPARVTCPECGKPRVVTRSLCPSCGKPFPKAARLGIEIFEPN